MTGNVASIARHRSPRFSCALGASALALFSFVVQLTTLDLELRSSYDEGLILYGADRVLRGDWPYKDFWTLYAPLQYWTLAGLFKIFGTHVLTERLYSLAVRSLFVVAATALTLRLAGVLPAAATWLLATAWLSSIGSYGYPLVPAGCMALLATYALVVHLETGSGRALFAAGALTGLTALFRHDIGCYLLLAEALGLVLAVGAEPSQPTTAKFASAKRAMRSISGLVSGFAAVTAPAAVLLLWHVPLEALWSQLIVFPLTIYPAVRGLPFPGPSDAASIVSDVLSGAPLGDGLVSLGGIFASWLPLGTILLIALTLIIARAPRARAPIAPALRSVLLFFALLLTLLFIKSLLRPHLPHFIHVLIPAFVALAALSALHMRSRRSGLATLGALGLLAAFLYPAAKAAQGLWYAETTTAAGVYAREPSRSTRDIFFSCPADAAGVPRGRCFRVPPNQRRAIEYVRRTVPPNQPIFVGAGRHDKLFANDVLFYFLAERPSATRYHELHPGLATVQPTQREIIRELENRLVNHVVLYTGADGIREPNASAESSGVSDLDDYLAEHFGPEQRFGPYSVLARKTWASPATVLQPKPAP